MRNTIAILTILAVASTAIVQPVLHASAAETPAAAPAEATLTLSDNTPTKKESWGTVVHYDTITVKPGTVVKVVLQFPVRLGYVWHVTWSDVKCPGTEHEHTAGGGLKSCSGIDLTPNQRGYDFTLGEDPALSKSGTQYEATIKVPDVPVTIRVDYAYFRNGGGTAAAVFEANIYVR